MSELLDAGAAMTESRLRAVDWSVMVLLSFDLFFVLFSSYPANSFRFFEGMLLASVSYLLTRLSIHTPIRINTLSGLLSAAGLYITFSSLSRFGQSVQKLVENGLTDLVDFRAQLLVPVRSWIPGEGFTALLLLLPVACAPAAYLWRSGRSAIAGIAFLSPVLILAALLLSFSRAVFGASVIFLLSAIILMLLYRVVTRKEGAILICGMMGCLLLVLLCEAAWYPNVLTAYLGHHASQLRSTQGRFEIWHRSLALVREHPLTGVGPSNAGLFLLSSDSADETTGFAGRAFSLPIQVLVEQGVLGFALYSFLLIVAALEFHRTMRTWKADGTHLETHSKRKQKQVLHTNRGVAAQKAMKSCFAAGILAVLLRELTYSSLFEHTATLAMMFALIALACKEVSSAS